MKKKGRGERKEEGKEKKEEKGKRIHLFLRGATHRDRGKGGMEEEKEKKERSPTS